MPSHYEANLLTRIVASLFTTWLLVLCPSSNSVAATEGRHKDLKQCASAAVRGKTLNAFQLKELIVDLSSLNGRNEYESKAAYQKRVRTAVLSAKHKLSRMVGAPYVIAVGSPFANMSYDADRGRLRIHFLGQDVIRQDQIGSYKFWKIAVESKDVGNASNASGVIVQKWEQTMLGIAFNPLPVENPRKLQTLELALAPAAAKRLRNEMKVLYVARLRPPFSITKFEPEKSKIAQPSDELSKYQALVARPLCGVLFDPANRQVLMELFPGPVPQPDTHPRKHIRTRHAYKKRHRLSDKSNCRCTDEHRQVTARWHWNRNPRPRYRNTIRGAARTARPTHLRSKPMRSRIVRRRRAETSVPHRRVAAGSCQQQRSR